MLKKPSFGLLFAFLLLATAGVAAAQTTASASASQVSATASRLAGDWHSTAAATLPNSMPAQFHNASDLGSAPASQQLGRMILLLTPSAAQQQALTLKLADLQNSSSASYHHWLTPAEFAASYANSSSDVAAVAAWLSSQGFSVAAIPTTRGWIEFSGTAGQVEQAFQADVHSFSTTYGTRPVLMGTISVPSALAPLVGGLVSLDGVVSTPALTAPTTLSVLPADLAGRKSATTAEALTPKLVAALIHLDTLQAAGTLGTGETIAIPSRSNVKASDIDAFRSVFGLQAQTLKVSPNGADPGLADDQAEATLAASWAGAAAPGAQILLVPAATTNATDGLDLALASIVDSAAAHTVEIGYSSCEAGLSTAHQAFYAALYQQAAAEGVAIVVAAGDSGASACSPAGSSSPVSTGYAVNGLASTQWNAAVGVAAFSPSDSSELKAWSPVASADPAYAGGGGSSTLYAGPDWQGSSVQQSAGETQGKRLLPDVVLPTAIDTSSNRGLAFCLSSTADSTGCTLVHSGGSSAASAIFSGISALVAETHGAQGSLTDTLYVLESKSGVYTDVQQGSTQLACTAGTSGCGTAGEIGYSAGAGYDLATGLGVVNAQALVNGWVSPQLGSGTTTVGISVSPNQATTGYNPSTSVTFTSTVISTTSGSMPTGTITFYDNTTGQSLTLPKTLVSGTATATLASGSGLALGDNQIIAEYSGDTDYAAANSTAINVHTVASTTSLTVTPSSTTVAPGQYITATAALTVSTPPAGAVTPTGIVTLYVDGNQSATASISTSTSPYTATFTNVLIPANSTATSHTLLATYQTNTDYVGSTSSTVTVTVAKTTPTITLTPAKSTALPGESVNLTATVAPSSGVSESVVPTGTVTFYQNSVQVGTEQLAAGSTGSTATLPDTMMSTAGTYSYTATYPGDSNYNSASSGTATITVAKGTPVITLTPSSTTPTGGSTISLTAVLTESNSTTIVPTGTVTFYDDGIAVGTATISTSSATGATATYTSFTVPTYGSHALTAYYNGDSEYNSATSSAITLTIAKVTTTVAVTPSTMTPTAGTTMQATATITPASYPTSQPSGTVTFTLDGSTTLGSASVAQGTPSTATLSFTMPASGSHTITVTYSGDTYYAAASGTSNTITASKNSTTLSLIPATTTPSAGNTLQVTANVNPSGNLSTYPTGTVTFTLDGATVSSISVTSASPAVASTNLTISSAGTHTLGATYSGDTLYATSTATPVTLNATKSTPTVTVTSSTTTPPAGTSMTLSSTVATPTTGATAATGTVTFYVDGASVGTSGVNSGTASLTVTAPTSLGAHTVTATYNGDSNYNSASSTSVGLMVGKITPTLTATPSTTNPTANATLMITATLGATSSSLTATGTVTFTLDGATVATGTLSGGATAIATITTPATGTHAIQAIYSGDSNFSSVTSAPVNIVVAKTNTSTTITPSTTTPALNSTLPVTVTVTPTTVNGTYLPSGTVAISVDGATLAVQVLTSGNPATASATLPAMSPGTHTLTAVYSGDTYYAASTSTSATVTVPKVTTATTVTPATTTPSGGAALSVSASVMPTTTLSALPTGTVSFNIDGTTATTTALISGNPASASAMLAASSLPPGTHTLTAVYSGDTNYAASTSAATALTVAKSPTTTTVIPSTTTPTAGSSMTITIDVATSNPATALPSGTVTLTEDGVSVGTGALAQGAPSVATITLNIVSAGTHILAASYPGDSYYTASNSSTVSIVANKGATTTTVTASPATLTANKTETLTATVVPTNAVTGVTYTLTGTVKFYDGTLLLGSASVASNTATLSGISLKDNVNHSITAVYLGDSNWYGSTSNALPLDATTLPVYVVLTSNFTTAPPGAAVVLTATVTPTTAPGTTGESNPTGIVIFYSGTTAIGQATLVAATGSVTSYASIATLTTQTLPGGQDTIYAVYQGDSYYDAATSNNLTITVQDFTITASSTNPATNLTIIKGSSGSASYDITGEGGFNNQVQVVCAVSSQNDMTCTASPQQVTPPGTVTFVVQTFKTGTTTSKMTPGPLWPRAIGGTALAVIGFLFLPYGRRVRRRLLERAGKAAERGLLMLLLLAGLVGTGVGCTSTSSVSTVSAGTPLGVATLKITATAYVNNAVVSHSLYLTVNVVTGN